MTTSKLFPRVWKSETGINKAASSNLYTVLIQNQHDIAKTAGWTSMTADLNRKLKKNQANILCMFYRERKQI
jgi:hypothetical protein